MTRSWREVLPIHPAADLFPMMSPEELKALGENIKKNGLQVPIVIWSETQDARLFLLDGRNRLDAMEAAGLEVCRADKNDRVEVTQRHLVGRGGGRSMIDGSRLTVDPYEFVLAANVHRRHLSAEQKRELIGKVLKARPEASDRQIAGQIKASPTTVGTIRRELVATDQIGQLDKRTGKDGKARTTARKAPSLARVVREFGAAKGSDTPPAQPASDKPSEQPTRDAAREAALLFEPDLEAASSDDGLDAARLRSQNKRLRAKLKKMRALLVKLTEDLAREQEQHSATLRRFEAEFGNDKAEEIARAICRLPDPVLILERSFWGLLEDDQHRVMDFVKANYHGAPSDDDVPAFLRKSRAEPEPASEPTPASEPAPPRRRGRPKGSTNRRPLPEAPALVERRKPGRPKGSKNRPKSDTQERAP